MGTWYGYGMGMVWCDMMGEQAKPKARRNSKDAGVKKPRVTKAKQAKAKGAGKPVVGGLGTNLAQSFAVHPQFGAAFKLQGTAASKLDAAAVSCPYNRNAFPQHLQCVCCSVFGVRCSVFGVRCSVFGVRCSVFGVRDSTSGSWFGPHSCILQCLTCPAYA